MEYLRRSVRIVLLLLWGVVIMVIAIFPYLFLFRWAKIRTAAKLTRFWARGAARIINLHVCCIGVVPKESGAMVVSSHVSYLDVLLCAATFPLRFAPKIEIRSWPLFGQLTALNCPVWIDRKATRKAGVYAQAFRETAEHGISMLVYPEGTTSDGRHGLKTFKSTPFASAIEGNLPLRPALVFYREAPGSFGTAAWFDDTPFPRHVWRVLGMKRIDAEIHLLPELSVQPGEERKALAERVHAVMEREYWKIAEKFYAVSDDANGLR